MAILVASIPSRKNGDTGKIIKKAEAAMKKEDYATAVKLANKAKTQGMNAQQQYQEQKNQKEN